MGSIAYMDFDLFIHRDETGYRAQVLNSPAGQAKVTFSIPFSDLEFGNLPLRMGRTRGGVRRIDSADVAAAKSFGGRLFATVFDGEVLGCLRSSLDEASRQDAGLRIRLRLTEVPELADLAWEYLYNPTLNRFLALSVETPIVRYLDLPQRIRPLAVTPPLRVLAMISSPDDYPQLDVEQEWAKLHEALSDLEQADLVTVERLDEATLASLLPRLQRGEYHIFHFIGHGGFDQQAQDGVLILEGSKRRGRPVSGQDLGTLLRDHRPMRLAVLNACEGARTSSTDPFAGTAQSLIQQGVPAVIAMQFEITDEAAITFANAFYGAVAGGYPVDAGLAEARKAIFAQGNSLEWGTPVLYMRAPDGRIFDVKQVSNEERRELRIAALYREAQTALAKEDWAAATEQLQAVLRLEPTHAEAQARLHEVRQQQELATWYATGQQHYDAGQWQAALEDFRRVQARGGNYKDVETLIATAQRELTRVRDEERRELRIAALYREAQTALAGEEWAAAVEKLQAVLRLEPTHAEAQARLREVRQQQELAAWYATGRQHYDAGQWQAALEDFRRVQEHGGNYKDVEALLATAQRELARVRDEERRALRIAAWYREAQTSLAKEDWTAATEQLQAVLRLEPTHAEAQARLHEVRQQQELAAWYATGRQHYDAGQWQVALEDFRRVQEHGGNYKDVEALLATAQRELARVRDEERRRAQSAALYREAQTALAKEDWTAATEQLQAVLRLEPTHAEAQARLHEVRQQQELAAWYATGRQHYDAGQWQVALEDFRRVQEHGGNYKDVEALLATAQRELARVRDEERRRAQSAALYREAQTALAREEWAAAMEQLQAVLRLEPTHAEAQARLHEVRQQQELATWYVTGQQHYDAGQWQDALEAFRRVRKRGGNYKGVDSLIVMVRRKISEEKPASNHISLRWIGVGGALALLVFIMLAWWGMQRGQPELPLRWQSIAVLSGYTAPVKSAVFSPDSKWVVAASYDPMVWVWEAGTGKGVAELRGHTAPVRSAVFSPDGKWIATASDDKMARVWEAGTGKGVAELQGHTAPVRSAVFSPDGKWIATASDDKMARVWEASTGKGVAELQGHTAPVKSAVFSPDGKWIATASSADPTVWVWEAGTGKGVAELRGHIAPVKSVVFSPDGKWVVAASDDPTVWVWEASTGKAVAELHGHAQWVNSVVFSPDGKWIVTASDDKTARVWEASTGKAVAELRGHTAEVNSAVSSRDGKWVVTASSDSTARVWEASTGKAVAELRGHTAEVNSAVFSRDGKWVVTASSDDTARVWKASRE